MSVRLTPPISHIIVPCALLLFLFLFGISFLLTGRHLKKYFRTLWIRLKKVLHKKRVNDSSQCLHTDLSGIIQLSNLPKKNGATDKKIIPEVKLQNFLSDFDREVIKNLQVFHVNLPEIFRMCLPALITLTLGPIFVVLYYEIMDCFWTLEDYPELPNINQGISCFLTPAGLVYAISFGFAFQSAILKQSSVLEKMTTEISYLDQIATLTSKLQLPSKELKKKIYKYVKCEAMYMVMQIQKKTLDKYKHKPEEDIKVEIWKSLGCLENIKTNGHCVDVVLGQRIVEYISLLNNICSDQVSILHAKIHWLKWCFLVTLGFFSLFGIMLIQASSYRMELMMTLLTLISVAMLCYIVADLDSPFSGFFRIDVSIIEDVVNRLELLYNMADCGYKETAYYPDSSKFFRR